MTMDFAAVADELAKPGVLLLVTPGFCGVYLSGFVSSARRRPVVRLSRQLRASSRQSPPGRKHLDTIRGKNISGAWVICPFVPACTDKWRSSASKPRMWRRRAMFNVDLAPTWRAGCQQYAYP